MRARLLGIGNRRAYNPAMHCTAQAQAAHQSLDRAACDLDVFTLHLPPDLVCVVDLMIGLPDLFDRWNQYLIAFCNGLTNLNSC